MASENRSLLAAQRWKLQLAFAAALIAGGLIWFDGWVSSALQLERYVPRAIGAVLGFVVLVAVCLAVRCPSCGKRLVWHALSTKPLHSWLEWLLDERTCPKCGYSVGDAAPRSGPGV